MDLPVKFPSESEVILADVVWFRALPPQQRIRTIRGILADGQFLMSRSSKAAWAEQDAVEQKLLERRNIQELVSRHAP